MGIPADRALETIEALVGPVAAEDAVRVTDEAYISIVIRMQDDTDGGELKLPVRLFQSRLEILATFMDMVKARLTPEGELMYLGMKGLIAAGIPMLKKAIRLSGGFLPDYPAYVRRTDPITNLIRYVAHALPTAASYATWVLIINPEGAVVDMDMVMRNAESEQPAEPMGG